MTRPRPTEPPRIPVLRSLPFRLAAAVVLTVFAGITLSTWYEYSRQRQLREDELGDLMDEECHVLLDALAYIPNGQPERKFLDESCALMDEHIAPGHQIVLLDPRGKVLMATHRHSGAGMESALLRANAQEGIIDLDDRRIAYARLKDPLGRTLMVGQFLDHLEATLAAQLRERVATAGVLGVVLVALIFAVLHLWVLRPTRRLMSTVRTWAARDFSARARVEGPAESRLLASALNTMAAELEHAEATRRAQLERARRVQAKLIPAQLPRVPGLVVVGSYRPAEEVAGDLYDVWPLSRNRTAMGVLDVSGHGLSAALLTGVAKMSLHRRFVEGSDLGRAMTLVNRDLRDCAPTGEFVTACFGTWDPVDLVWTWCAAGHAGGLLLSQGELTALEDTGPLLGVMGSGPWEARKLKLGLGDRLFLYTDGLTDAGVRDVSLGEDGLRQLIAESASLNLAAQVAHVTDAAMSRCGVRTCDDITLLAFEVIPRRDTGRYFTI